MAEPCDSSPSPAILPSEPRELVTLGEIGSLHKMAEETVVSYLMEGPRKAPPPILLVRCRDVTTLERFTLRHQLDLSGEYNTRQARISRLLELGDWHAVQGFKPLLAVELLADVSTSGVVVILRTLVCGPGPMSTVIRVCGPDGWQDDWVSCKELAGHQLRLMSFFGGYWATSDRRLHRLFWKGFQNQCGSASNAK